MENESRDDYEFPILEFRMRYNALKQKIGTLKRKRKCLDFNDTYNICKDVEEQILDLGEDPNLSILQNKYRKLDVGAELCKEISVLHRQFCNLEINRVVSEILEEEKYEKIARKIISREKLRVRRENFFYQQAMNCIKESLRIEKENENRIEGFERQESDESTAQQQNRLNIQEIGQSSYQTMPELDSSYSDAARAMHPNPDHLLDENLMSSDAEEARVSNVSLPVIDITIPVPEYTTTNREKDSLNDINEIVRILENGIERVSMDENIGLVTRDKLDIPESSEATDLKIHDINNLPPIEDNISKRKKRNRLVIDRSILIQDYSRRAHKLNQSVVVERTQVFEGPISIINAFKLEHVLRTPAVNNGFSGACKSSVLEQLYTRHMKTEKRSYVVLENNFMARESVVPVSVQSELISYNKNDEIREKQQSSLNLLRPYLLEMPLTQGPVTQTAETTLQKKGVEGQVERISENAAVSENFANTIISSGPSEKINHCLPPGSSHMTNFQSFVEDQNYVQRSKLPPCTAPKEKWREFKYVMDCLNGIWQEKENQKLEKSVTLKEVLDREQDWTRENMMTLLRIVDKLSLRREVVVKRHGAEVIVQPFEVPYVTEKQYLLRRETPQF